MGFIFQVSLDLHNISQLSSQPCLTHPGQSDCTPNKHSRQSPVSQTGTLLPTFPDQGVPGQIRHSISNHKILILKHSKDLLQELILGDGNSKTDPAERKAKTAWVPDTEKLLLLANVRVYRP